MEEENNEGLMIPNNTEENALRITHLACRLVCEGIYYNDEDKLNTGVVFMDCLERFKFSTELCFAMFSHSIRTTYMLMSKSNTGEKEFAQKVVNVLTKKAIEYQNFTVPYGKALVDKLNMMAITVRGENHE